MGSQRPQEGALGEDKTPGVTHTTGREGAASRGMDGRGLLAPLPHPSYPPLMSTPLGSLLTAAPSGPCPTQRPGEPGGGAGPGQELRAESKGESKTVFFSPDQRQRHREIERDRDMEAESEDRGWIRVAVLKVWLAGLWGPLRPSIIIGRCNLPFRCGGIGTDGTKATVGKALLCPGRHCVLRRHTLHSKGLIPLRMSLWKL